jgi:Fe-S cluster biogenesis protein NfuA
MNVLSIQPTPNPNAFKFMLNETIQAEGSRYYNTATEASADALGAALFAIPGVETVYFAQDFATVTNVEGANLETLHQQIRQVLDTHEGSTSSAEKPTGSPAPIGEATDDPGMMKQINELLDDRVRPALAGDGGGLEVLTLDSKVLTIRYQGACGSCPSSIAGTLHAIQNLLQVEVDEELTVVSG